MWQKNLIEMQPVTEFIVLNSVRPIITRLGDRAKNWRHEKITEKNLIEMPPVTEFIVLNSGNDFHAT